MLKNDHTSVTDAEPFRHPATVTTTRNDEMIQKNRTITVKGAAGKSTIMMMMMMMTYIYSYLIFSVSFTW